MEAALLQAATSIAGATLALRKDMPGAYLIAFFRCMNTWFCKLFLKTLDYRFLGGLFRWG
jgi:hypothetical protein